MHRPTALFLELALVAASCSPPTDTPVAPAISGSISDDGNGSAPAETQAYDLTPLAYLGNPAPEGGEFTFDFEPSSINNSGEVSFAADVTTGGGAYCWGANGDGQLGDGTTTNRLTQVAVGAGLALMALAGGHYHTCGLTTGGEAYCWGSNEFGGLGDGTLISRLAPVAVSGGFTFTEVPRGGYGHSCARASTGTAYCWGYNDFAQLGDGSTNSSSVPVRVAGQP